LESVTELLGVLAFPEVTVPEAIQESPEAVKLLFGVELLQAAIESTTSPQMIFINFIKSSFFLNTIIQTKKLYFFRCARKEPSGNRLIPKEYKN
jgi:hypothetical protein